MDFELLVRARKGRKINRYSTATRGTASVLAVWILLGVSGVGTAGELPFLHPLFTDHMVLQAGASCPVWGWSAPGDAVTVTFGDQTVTAVTAADGRWEASLKASRASANARSLTVVSTAGGQRVELHDVLVGEVWICSGQSNMEMALRSAQQGNDEVAVADLSEIRLFTVSKTTATIPQPVCAGAWAVCTPDTAAGFSAVGYFFGRHLHRQLNVPVGLIHSSRGGTPAEAWVSEPGLRQAMPDFNRRLDRQRSEAETREAAAFRYQAEIKAFRAAKEEIYAREENLAAATATYARVDLDDDAWKTMTIPNNWETTEDLRTGDGIVWFRKAVDIPQAWAGKDLVLRPGPIDEVDVTWFNGVQVGASGNMRKRDTSFWNVPRAYRIPGHLVKAGRNVVAIRVIDLLGEGGLWGGAPESMVLERADAPGQGSLPLAGAWRYLAEFLLPPPPEEPGSPHRPSVLFNAMINPLIPYAVRAAIWYQGEANEGRAEQYHTLLPALIADWRQRFAGGDFPFLIVQLANFKVRLPAPSESNWARVREAQAKTARTVPAAGLAVAIDIGGADIHPINKQDVGLRLGLAAEAIAYGREVEHSGPVFETMEIEAGKALLRFSHGSGLTAKDGPLTGFAVAGADRRFVWAQAEIRGATVEVWTAEVPQPVAVRYAWAHNPACNLYNGAGLPAVPFRTDDW